MRYKEKLDFVPESISFNENYTNVENYQLKNDGL